MARKEHRKTGETDMAKKTGSSEAISSAQVPEKGNGAVPKPPEIADLLAKADQLLQAGEPKKALDLIARAKFNSPWTTNALGVCQLRLGNAKVAVDVFRGLVLAAGGILLRSDVPAVFKTNYATALLLAENMGGCLSVLAEVRDEHPAVGKLKAAIQRWKEGMTLWQKINWYMGGQPDRPVALDFPPGDLG
jgi:hypothetical protein